VASYTYITPPESPFLPPLFAPLLPTLDEEENFRPALEAHAAARDHPSVEAWLRAAALQPQKLTADSLFTLLDAMPTLTAAEQSAAADLFCAFSSDLKDWSVFHPFLLKKSTFKGLLKKDEMIPSCMSHWVGCESR
jgi:hypothetical protein